MTRIAIDKLSQSKDGIEDSWETVDTVDDMGEAFQIVAGLLNQEIDVQITLWEVDDEGNTVRALGGYETTTAHAKETPCPSSIRSRATPSLSSRPRSRSG
jgi:hypothetical protein